MIKNFIKVAIRSLQRNKGYTVINILGLALGIAFSCIMYIYVANELSFDELHTKSERIYRPILIDKRVPDQIRKYAVNPPPLVAAMINEFPEVTNGVNLHRFTGQVVFEINGQKQQERNWYTTDSTFFDVFDFKFIYGDRATALDQPFSLVLTQEMSERFYGNQNPIGKILEMSGYGPVTITGVVENIPENSHLTFNMLFSEILNDDDWKSYLINWRAFGANSYFVLQEGADVSALTSKIEDFKNKYFGDFGAFFDLEFQGVENVYFESEDIEAGVEQTHGYLPYLYIFGSMGIFLLLIAAINYINLATSKAVFRAKEISIRKVVGAYKAQLVFQFLTESFIVTSISFVLAIGIIDLSLPFFNQLIDKSFDLNFNNLQDYLLPLFIISLMIALLSGSYPAFYLAKLQPVKNLKGDEVGSKQSVLFRKSLVTFQFILTIVMLVSTLIIGKQLTFIQEKDMGFNKDNLLVIDINSRNVRQQFQTMKNEFLAIPGVESVGVSSRVPGEWKNISQHYVQTSYTNREVIDSVQTYLMGFDEGMIETYHFKLKSGSYFQSNSAIDSTRILLNEAAVTAFGLSDPIGSVIRIPMGRGRIFNATVIGVFEDFNFQSLHQKIAPMIIGAWNNPLSTIDYFSLKVTGDMTTVIERASEVHNKFDQNSPIEFHFLDKQLQVFYASEERVGKFFYMSSFLSIFIACLGLLGLASFTVEKRKKEIGIRKVLGASEVKMFLLLSSSLGKQILVAFVIASPIAYFMMENWLTAFEYRVGTSIENFLIAGIIAILLALLTISYHALKAIHSNPIESLRRE